MANPTEAEIIRALQFALVRMAIEAKGLDEDVEALQEIVRDLESENFQLRESYAELHAKYLKASFDDNTDDKSNRKRLTADEVRSIRQMHTMGYTNRYIAEEIGINPATVSRIVRGIYHAA